MFPALPSDLAPKATLPASRALSGGDNSAFHAFFAAFMGENRAKSADSPGDENAKHQVAETEETVLAEADGVAFARESPSRPAIDSGPAAAESESANPADPGTAAAPVAEALPETPVAAHENDAPDLPQVSRPEAALVAAVSNDAPSPDTRRPDGSQMVASTATTSGFPASSPPVPDATPGSSQESPATIPVATSRAEPSGQPNAALLSSADRVVVARNVAAPVSAEQKPIEAGLQELSNRTADASDVPADSPIAEPRTRTSQGTLAGENAGLVQRSMATDLAKPHKVATSAHAALVQGRLSIAQPRDFVPVLAREVAPHAESAVPGPLSGSPVGPAVAVEAAGVKPPLVTKADTIAKAASVTVTAIPPATSAIPAATTPTPVLDTPALAANPQINSAVPQKPALRTDGSVPAMMMYHRINQPTEQTRTPGVARPLVGSSAGHVPAPMAHQPIVPKSAPGAQNAEPPLVTPPATTTTHAESPEPTPLEFARPAPLADPAAPPRHVETVQSIARQIATQIPSANSAGFEVALAPDELGSVRIRLHAAEAGSVLIVHAERPETMDLMRRHIATLEQDLRNLGHESLSVRFASGGPGAGFTGGFGNAHSGQQANAEYAATHGESDRSHSADTPPISDRLRPPAAIETDHLDLRL